jgi:hypothetical protein
MEGREGGIDKGNREIHGDAYSIILSGGSRRRRDL